MELYKETTSKNKDVTIINPDTFKAMVTNAGISVHELNEKNAKVLLFFLKSVG
jgi:hypothetical protein